MAKHIESGLGINVDGAFTAENCGQAHFTTSVVNREFNLSAPTILSLTANDTIQLAIRTTTAGTPDIDVHNCNMTVVQVGG